MISDLIDELNRTDLRPSPRVNALFSELVAHAGTIRGDHPALVDPIDLARVHRICALGETRLEEYWADRILADPARLSAFPYLHNYRDLARSEHRALTATCPDLRHVVFAGCGPLPLTVIELARLDPDLRITGLDLDPVAATRARAVTDAVLPAGHRVEVVCADAVDHDYTGADVVVIAALVGTAEAEKLDLMARIGARLPRGAILALRSVPEDGRQLLYPRIDPVRAGRAPALTLLGEWPPPPGVINSLLLLQGEQ